MSGTANLVFAFIAVGIVAGGMVLIASTMFSEAPVVASPENVNITSDLIADTGIMASGFVIPILILIAAMVAISVIYLITKKR